MYQGRIIIVGTGNIAWHFVSILSKRYAKQLFVLGRNQDESTTLAKTFDIQTINDFHSLNASDIIILAVNDDAISSVSQLLPEEAFVIHTSGTVSISYLRQTRAGVFWPIVSLKKNIPLLNYSYPALMECKLETDYAVLSHLFEHSGFLLSRANSAQRLIAHLGAVISNNLVNDLWVSAAHLLTKHNLSFELMLPLIQSHVAKLQNELPEHLQTGPAIRGDETTLSKHIELLNNDPELQNIYSAISKHIQRKNLK